MVAVNRHVFLDSGRVQNLRPKLYIAIAKSLRRSQNEKVKVLGNYTSYATGQLLVYSGQPLVPIPYVYAVFYVYFLFQNIAESNDKSIRISKELWTNLIHFCKNDTTVSVEFSSLTSYTYNVTESLKRAAVRTIASYVHIKNWIGIAKRLCVNIELMNIGKNSEAKIYFNK
ncbi:hypothetical protein Bhyg_05522 [Pseudolycoriella hygida]|uniref:Uncharacterized protein n=1 Tax=Pseudolycoriella hygida TaxID=35572 RepID=A0A9Q0MZU5_9DIPT|nr:hypothetical protein Bhyg_05522 [Pseudolycoriella hygida]